MEREVSAGADGYSRLLWMRFYPRQTMTVLMEGLEGAFEKFGGVPEELLFDQMRAVVLPDDRTAGGDLVLNAEFLRIAAHWGFVPRLCRALPGPHQGQGGPPGVGKTHLAISLAIAAAEAGRRVYYGTLAGLIESLSEAKAAGNLSRRLRVLTHPALLVVDEIRYLPISPGRRRAVLPAHQRPARTRLDRADVQQGLRGLGRRARRSCRPYRAKT